MTRYVRAYIEAKLEDERRIRDIRDQVHRATRPGDKYCLKEPHLNIIPPFSIPEQNLSDLNDAVEDIGLVGREVPVDGAGVWPSLNNPRVALLDARIDLSSERNALLDTLSDLGAERILSPVDPHITLFKADSAHNVTAKTTRNLQQAVWNHRDQWSTTIKYVDVIVVEEQSPPKPGTNPEDARR